MADHLWLNEARTILAESGEASLWEFGQATAEDTAERLARGELQITGGYLDPVAGHIVGEPEWSHGDMSQAAWTASTPANWFDGTVEPFILRTGSYAKALLHITGDDWTLTANAAAGWGGGFFLRLVTYAGDVGTGDVTVTFGGGWKLALPETGQAVLSEQVNGAWVRRAAFDWVAAAEFAPASHWLWVYEVGPKLVVQNLAPDARGRRLGCVWQDVGQWIDQDGAAHALRPGLWSIASSGYAAVSMVSQAWRAGAVSVASGLQRVGWAGSSKQLTATVHGHGSPAVTLTAYDEDGAVWPQDTDPAGLREQVRWTAGWTSSSSATYALSGIGLEWPATYQSDGNTAVDLLAVSGVADQQIVLSRDDDCTREHLAATLPATGAFAAYIKPNMAIRYIEGSTTLFRGLTDDPQWQVLYDRTPQFGIVNLQAQGLWRRFRGVAWPGGRPFDGRSIEDCVADVCAAAGIQSSEYELATTGRTFPAAPTGQPPALCYRAGVTLDAILADLADKWYGRDYWHFFRLADGKFVLEARTTGSSVATFYDTAAAAAAAAVPGQVILSGSYQETLDDSEMANVIRVTGQSPTGRPLQAMAIDWDSIQDVTATNYVGEPWIHDIIDPGLQTQSAVNLVCRSAYDRRRWPKVCVEWRSIRLNLFPGQIVTLVGTNLSSISVQLTSMSAERANSGDANDALGRASYSGEVV